MNRIENEENYFIKCLIIVLKNSFDTSIVNKFNLIYFNFIGTFNFIFIINVSKNKLP